MSFLMPNPPFHRATDQERRRGEHAHTSAPARHPRGRRGHQAALRASWPQRLDAPGHLRAAAGVSASASATPGFPRVARWTMASSSGSGAVPGGHEPQLEADELRQAHPRAARELEPVAEEERGRVTDDLPGQEPVHLGMLGLTGGLRSAAVKMVATYP
jgi:hypothetical protein